MSVKFNCIIPARGGSRDIPLKNIIDLAGQPLLYYTIEIALKCHFIKNTYVSTDNDKIANLADNYFGVKIINRPNEYSLNDTPDKPVLKHAISIIDDFSDVIYLRPTCPIRQPSVLNEAIEYFIKNRDICTSLKSVNKIKPIAKNFFKKGIYLSGCMPQHKKKHGDEYFMLPRQQYEQCYEGNSYVDILKPATFMYDDKDICYGNKILFFETPKSIDIDTYDDLQYLKWKIQNTKITR